MTYAGTRVLVTGGLGFLGSNLACRLARDGAHVTVMDSSVPGCGGNRFNLEPFSGQIRLIPDDIRAVESYADELKGTSLVLNLAGEISHINSMRDPLRDLDINTTAQLKFLLGLKNICPGVRIVYASTRQVYGMPQYLPINEGHPVNPIDFNGIHKFAAAVYHRLLTASGDLDATILRFTNIYGPRMALNIPEQGVLSHFVRHALRGEPIEIFGDGRQVRDPIFVDDAVDACLLAAAATHLRGVTLNAGGMETLSIGRLAEMVAAEGGHSRSVFRPFPEGHKAIDIGSFSTDNSMIEQSLGWKPRIPFAEGVRRTLAFYREHQEHYLP